MSIFAALGQGIKLVRSNIYIVWLVYISTLAIALFFVLPFQQTVTSEIGQSLEIGSMLESYRHTVVADFLNEAGDKIAGLLAQLKWLIVCYILLSIFFSGAILYVFNQKNGNSRSFLQGGAIYFGRFLRLSVYLWTIQILLAGIIHFPFISQLLQGLDSIGNEVSFFRTGLIGILVHLPLAILIFAISDFAKVHIVKTEEKKVWKAIWHTIILFRTFFLKTYSIYVVNGLLIVGIYGIYLLISNGVGMSSSVTIVVMFFVQQFVSILRVAVKALKLGSIMSIYNDLVPLVHTLRLRTHSK